MSQIETRDKCRKERTYVIGKVAIEIVILVVVIPIACIVDKK